MKKRAHRRTRIICSLIAVLPVGMMLAGCAESPGDDPGAPVVTAATLGAQQVKSVTEYLAESRYAAADPGRGEQEAQLCRACHSLEEDGPTLLGPSLYGMFGSKAGSRGDYGYSRALAGSDFIWTPRALEAWLAAPARFLPGNRMSFAGVLDDQKRADLVAYLLTATAPEVAE